MKNILISLLLPVLIQAGSPLSAFAGDKSIYGADNRQDYFQVSPATQQLADSVVSLWESGDVIADGNVFKLATVNFSDAASLCPAERFRDQPTGGFCSGSLVGEDLVMTAGHCIQDEAGCAGTKFVFGFNIRNDGGAAATTLPVSEVYGCKKIVKREQVATGPGIWDRFTTISSSETARLKFGPDYALIQLDRKVSNHKPLRINRAQKLAKGDGLFVIGHPVGLPLKVAGDAKVRDASKNDYFLTDLDTYGGNSGSPVFSAATGLIEGILVRGDNDFLISPAGCRYSSQVSLEAGRGEDVARISLLANLIPAQSGEAPAFRDMQVGSINSALSGLAELFNLKFQ